MNTKAFTLIELLVVIAILAVLAVAVTLILNPAELIRQGRTKLPNGWEHQP
jgi:prepilin-type N-terminal cleavage/methylation domain-containing protein